MIAWSGRLSTMAEANRAQLWLFAPVMLGLGIWLWFVLPAAEMRLAAMLAGIAIATLGLGLRGAARPVLVAAGLLLALGIVAAEYRSASVAGPRLYHRLTAWPVAGTIIAREPRDGGASTRLVIERPADGADAVHRVRITLPGHLPPAYRPGAVVRVEATLGPVPGPVLPGAHDPGRAAWFQGIAAVGRATGPPDLLRPAASAGLRARLDGLRQDLEQHLLHHLPGDAGGLAAALVVGEQGNIRPELVDAMRIAGLAHLLTVSGFHVGIVVAGVFLILRHAVALWPWLALRVPGRAVAAIAAALAGTVYALLSGAEVPAVRAAIMAWVVMLALASGRDPLSLRLLAFAAFLILLARPEYLLSPSFQLSFAAVAGLILLAHSRPGQRLLAPRGSDRPAVKAGRYALALVASGLVAELLLSPIALAHFGRSGAYGVLANLVAIPLTSFLIMPLVGLFGLLSVVGLGGIAAVPLAWSLGVMAATGTVVAGLPGASLTVPALPALAFGLGIAGAILMALLSGPLRWVGLPALGMAVLLAIAGPRPDMFVAADGRQVALASDTGLHALRPHRRGFQWQAWERAARRPDGGLLADLGPVRCGQHHCIMERHGLVLLMVTDADLPPGRIDAACASADIVTAPGSVGPGCSPRLMLLDRSALSVTGPVAIDTRRRRIVTGADVAGDHPWSAAMLPGTRTDLLGRRQWTGVIAE